MIKHIEYTLNATELRNAIITYLGDILKTKNATNISVYIGGIESEQKSMYAIVREKEEAIK